MPKIPTLQQRVPLLRATRTPSITTATTRISGTPGYRIRNAHLDAHPLCVQCEQQGRVEVAVVVDHIIPLADGGPESRDPEHNRQALCKAHHDAKSRLENRKRYGLIA